MEPVVRRAFVPTVAFYEELDEGPIGEFYRGLRKRWSMASEANPVLQDVEAQLHRIHCAVNDGTLDRAAVADALRLIHDFVSGAAYESAEEAPAHEEDYAGHEDDEVDEGGEEHPAKRKPRKKR